MLNKEMLSSNAGVRVSALEIVLDGVFFWWLLSASILWFIAKSLKASFAHIDLVNVGRQYSPEEHLVSNTKQ